MSAKKPTMFNFDAELKDTLFAILHREGKSFTEWIHDQAKEYVKRHGAGNPAVPLQKWMDDPEYIACPTLLEMEGFNWKIFDLEDLRRFEAILIKERNRIYSVRRSKE